MIAECGDVIQIDGGLVIVTSTNGDKANVSAVSDFNGKAPHALKNGINRQITNDRLFERRGASGLEDFLKCQKETKSAKAKGMIKLELGDALCYEGRLCTVTAVDEKWSTLGDLDGNVWQDYRWLNQFFFQDCVCHQLVRLNAEQRAENLKQFLQQRKSPLLETEECDEIEKPHIETMSKKAKTPKAKTTKTAAATPKVAKSFAGSSVFIRECITKGDDKAKVIAKVTEKYGMPERMIIERFEAQSKLAKGATA